MYQSCSYFRTSTLIKFKCQTYHTYKYHRHTWAPIQLLCTMSEEKHVKINIYPVQESNPRPPGNTMFIHTYNFSYKYLFCSFYSLLLHKHLKHSQILSDIPIFLQTKINCKFPLFWFDNLYCDEPVKPESGQYPTTQIKHKIVLEKNRKCVACE